MYANILNTSTLYAYGNVMDNTYPYSLPTPSPEPEHTKSLLVSF